MKFQALRGFRDYLPPDPTMRAHLFATLRRVATLSGFEEVETPSLESLELFKVKSGEGIVDQTFSFTDKGGREVTLVPENTPSVARLIAERAKAIPIPVKWISLPKLWRYEEPQAGRLREFSQLSVDIFGAKGVEAEIEVLATTKAMLDALGLEGRYVFRVSDRRIAEGLARAFQALDLNAFFRALDRSKKLPPKEVANDLGHAGLVPEAVARLQGFISQTGTGERARELLHQVSTMEGVGEETQAGITNLQNLFTLGASAGLSDVLILDLAIVRGLGYYTSTVFEAYDTGQSMRSLFGGGRYDKLVELFGGPPMPACGLAIGDQILELLLREAGLWPEGSRGPQVYVASVAPTLKPEVLAWTRRLRSGGLATECDIMGRNLSGQMKEAARRGALALLILGPEERARGEVVVRNMRTGQQLAVSDDAVEPQVRKILAGPEAPQAPVAD